MDTIKMIAYRAETSMGTLLKDKTTDMAAARRLLQDLYVTEADILPQPEKADCLYESIMHPGQQQIKKYKNCLSI